MSIKFRYRSIFTMFFLLTLLLGLVTTAQGAPLNAYPTDPIADIPWSPAGMTTVGDIQDAFNSARTAENAQLGSSVPLLTMPSQAAWDSMSDGEKALWLINRERIDRGVHPLHGVETNVTGVAQDYAQYLLDNDAIGHTADGHDPWWRLDQNPTIRFENEVERGTIVVQKGTNPPGAPDVFEFVGDFTGSLKDGEEFQVDDVLPGTYTVQEVVPPDWALTSITCFDNNSDGDVPTATATFRVEPGERVVCAFNNYQAPGTIIVEKQTDPDGASESFEFATDYGPNFDLTDNQTNDSGPLTPGIYSVSEINLPAGWSLTSATCDDGSDPSAIDLDAGETVTCTFTNTQDPPPTGKIIIEKQTNPDGSPESFEFEPSYGANFFLSDGQTNDSGQLPLDTYQVREIPPPGWTVSNLSCVCNDCQTWDQCVEINSSGQCVRITKGVSINLQADETATCTFSNTHLGNIIVEKQTIPDGATESFEFTPSYGSSFSLSDGQTNDSGPLPAGIYSVSETVLPAGWTLSSATCSDGSPPNAIDLDVGETVTCTFNNEGPPQPGALTIIKEADPEDGTDFAFTSNIPVSGGFGNISTVAGNGTGGFGGDGGPATAAQLYIPYGVAVDNAGNFFIADTYNHRIRRVDAGTGNISTVAGNGTGGFAGDGGPATAAQLNLPLGVAVDSAGNLFIADNSNQRIRRVDATTGLISTVAGNGTFGFSGDGGPATAAQLKAPYGVAVDSAGNLWIADTFNHRVRRVDATTGLISTVAGNGTAGSGGDGGPATAAQLNNPTGVALDSAGNLLIADRDNQRIRRVDAGTGNISTVAGNGTAGSGGDGGPATAAQLHRPWGVALDSADNLLIADRLNHRIRRVDAGTGNISTVAGTGVAGYNGDGGPATAAQLSFPNGVALDSAGSLFIADTTNHRIRQVGPAMASFTLDDANPDDSDGVNQSITFNDLSAGTYEITETVPGGWQLDSATCTGASGSVSLNGETLSVAVGAGETVECTFTNTLPRGTIIVEKQTDPDGAPDSFTFSGDAAGAIKDDEQIVVSNLPPGPYTSQETVPAGWELTSIVCDDDNSTVSLADRRANFQLEAGETVKCTFYNRLPLDYGDAPDSYGTLLASNGARHAIVQGHSMGPIVDAEPDGQPSPLADGDDNNPPGAPDDEDGVTLPPLLTAGTPGVVIVDGGPSGGMLDAWIDFNGNGVFDHPAEHLFGGISVLLGPGPNPPLTFPVPSTAVPGATYARFRLSNNGGLLPTGFASDGEVEDYLVEIEGQPGTIIVEKQTDPDGAPDSFTFSGDASGAITDDQQIVVTDLPPGPYTSQETVPAGWELTSIVCDDDNSTVSLADRRANFQLEAGETVKCTFYNRLPLDYGDAPDSYGTLLASNGARHAIVQGHSLGPIVDAEPDGQPTPLADGDDLNPPGAPDDEDGVTLPPAALTAGDPAAPVIVDGGPSGGLLDAWIDFNGNGVFDHPAEHLWNGASQLLISGPNPLLPFPVPATAVPGPTYARFRLSNNGGLAPTGFASNGEVEDYRVEIGEPQPGTIIVEKQTDPDGAPDSFEFSTSYSPNFFLVDDQTNNSGPLAAGIYSVSEINIPAGWTLTSATCDDGSDPSAIDLEAGETVKCTFTNTRLPGTIIVEKQTVPDGAPDSFTFSGDASGAIKDGEQIVVGDLAPGAYTSQETVPTGWNLTAIVCDDSNSTGSILAATATFQLEAGETVKCTFTNTEEPTAVDLISFTAEADAGGVTLSWETATETDTAGFNLWRSQTATGTYVKVNATLVAAQGDALSGASYTYPDTGLSPDTTYYYKLEELSNGGGSTFHGPVSVKPLGSSGDSPPRIYLPLIVK